MNYRIDGPVDTPKFYDCFRPTSTIDQETADDRAGRCIFGTPNAEPEFGPPAKNSRHTGSLRIRGGTHTSTFLGWIRLARSTSAIAIKPPSGPRRATGPGGSWTARWPK